MIAPPGVPWDDLAPADPKITVEIVCPECGDLRGWAGPVAQKVRDSVVATATSRITAAAKAHEELHRNPWLGGSLGAGKAFLMSGPTGSGKSTSAFGLALAVNGPGSMTSPECENRAWVALSYNDIAIVRVTLAVDPCPRVRASLLAGMWTDRSGWMAASSALVNDENFLVRRTLWENRRADWDDCSHLLIEEFGGDGS